MRSGLISGARWVKRRLRNFRNNCFGKVERRATLGVDGSASKPVRDDDGGRLRGDMRGTLCTHEFFREKSARQVIFYLKSRCNLLKRPNSRKQTTFGFCCAGFGFGCAGFGFCCAGL